MAEQNESLPFEIKDVESSVNTELLKYFTGEFHGYVRVGPKGYILPKKYREEAANIYNFSVRPSDTFIVTYPRSGTTWTQELIWLIANDNDYATATTVPLMERFPFIELPILLNPVTLEILKEENNHNEEILKQLELFSLPFTKMLADAPSPRFIKTHLPLSLLPPSLLDSSKVVFVARDPRDVAVSFYHHNRLIRFHGFNGDFKKYWNFFINDLIMYTPFFEYLKEAWEKRHHPNMLFLFYEDLSKDLPSAVRRVAEFLGKQLTEPQVERLCDHLSFENFKKNKAINDEDLMQSFTNKDEQGFIRKGKAGGWRDHFDAQMTEEAERWIADNLRDTDLRFPDYGQNTYEDQK